MTEKQCTTLVDGNMGKHTGKRAGGRKWRQKEETFKASIGNWLPNLP
jgi:hypothetical protein